MMDPVYEEARILCLEGEPEKSFPRPVRLRRSKSGYTS